MLRVQERPPTALTIEAETPKGRFYRWGDDALNPENVPADLRFSTTMPGGFESLDARLPRLTGVDYPDMERLTTLRAIDAGGGVAWEGRLERAPRTVGYEFAISPSAVGWQAALEDRKDVKEIYVDRELAKWASPSTQRKLDLIALSTDYEDAQVVPDATTGEPSLDVGMTGAWGRTHLCEAWYDAANIDLGSVYYSWKRSSSISAVDFSWTWSVNAHQTDTGTSSVGTGNLRAAGPGTGTLSVVSTGKKYASVVLLYDVAAGLSGVRYSVFFPALAVYGRHGLTLRNSGTANAAPGLLVSDIVQDAVTRFALPLKTDIEPTTYVVEQASYLEPTSVADIIKDVDKYVLSDWGVWEDKTFCYSSRGSRGRAWRARTAPAELEETGPQIDRLWNSVVVSFKDTDGSTRTVGPPGSGAYVETTALQDLDPAHPLNELGMTRSELLTMDLSTTANATEVGRRFLTEQRLLDTSGRAKFVGHVEDDRGVTFPAHAVRAGDTVEFVDAADPSPRRIVKTDYTHDGRECSVDLDSPPEGLAALLERLGASVASLT